MQNCNIPRTAAVALVLSLAACGGDDVRTGGTHLPPSPPPQTSLTPQQHLQTPRFRIHQPRVLEQVGAHHAYAKGLTGQGVTIGIEDTIVDYTQRREFGNRVKLRYEDGARLAYDRPFGDDPRSEAQKCQLNLTCNVGRGNSRGDPESVNKWVQQRVQQILPEDNWPETDDSVFIVDEYWLANDPIGRLFRWYELPTPYGGPREGGHGTVVASVAAGKNLGIAPGATIVPIAKNLTDDQGAEPLAGLILRTFIDGLSEENQELIDERLSNGLRDSYTKFDIINRSYGIQLIFAPVAIPGIVAEIDWFAQHLPKTLDALWQRNTPDNDKTILVYAAGNDGDPAPAIEGNFPFYIPALRGHSLSVAATDPGTGLIDDYSNRCGLVPLDWNAAVHGPHYCLVAPGTVRGLVPDPMSPGEGKATAGLQGTSFAAPVVAGSLALLMEHFRGTRGNTAIVKRMMDTADRTGAYADLETYGAGHLDLEAALSPVGTLSVGQYKRALSDTTLGLPGAFGSMNARMASLELAAFDEQEFPFWMPVSGLVSTKRVERSPIPEIEPHPADQAPGAGLDALALHWTPVGTPGPGEAPREQELVAGFGPTSASLARVPGRETWGYGLSFSDGEYLGSRASGAFGSDLRSGMIWSSRSFETSTRKRLEHRSDRDIGIRWRAVRGRTPSSRQHRLC